MDGKNLATKNIHLKNSKTLSQHLRLLWRDIRDSISGKERDYTSGSINRAIVLLSIPMVLEVALESVFGLVDIYFVSKINSTAIATVGITESLITIVYAIGIGTSMATTALISRRTGEKNPEGASSAAMQSIVLAVIVSLILAIPGIFFSKELLKLMGATNAIVNEYSIYTSLIIGGNIVVMLLFVINAIFRSAGDAALSMKILWTANLVNIALDPILIFGLGPIPALGIKGAAIASLTGRGFAVLIQFYLLYKGVGRTKIRRRHIKIEPKVLLQIMKLSLGGVGQYLIATASWVVLMRLMNQFGDQVVAGYTIAIRLFMFTLLPSWGMSNAAATLVGQNLGAKKPDRAEYSIVRTAIFNSMLMIFFAVLFISSGEYFVRLFSNESDVVGTGKIALQTISYGYLFYGLGMIMPQSFNGAGDTTTPTWINFISYWLVQIPIAYFLAVKLEMRETGVFWAIIVAESLMATLSVILFKKGKWKLMEV